VVTAHNIDMKLQLNYSCTFEQTKIVRNSLINYITQHKIILCNLNMIKCMPLD